MEHRLDWKRGELWFGEINLEVSCELDACRKLLQLGLANERDSVVTYRAEMRCLKTGVGWGSKREVTVSGDGAPVFRRLRLGKRLREAKVDG